MGLNRIVDLADSAVSALDLRFARDTEGDLSVDPVFERGELEERLISLERLFPGA